MPVFLKLQKVSAHGIFLSANSTKLADIAGSEEDSKQLQTTELARVGGIA